ncbi:hypothetical protein MNO15_002918 [Vibrio parahaemolyticus]|nr:hypothetical protein [Vibrio parahaemolyticus]HCH6295507.1 hypothetical protein [Vibrio parahaemolyticus]
MSIMLGLSLIIVHNSPKLLEILAEQAINSGCHQTTETTNTMIILITTIINKSKL